MWRGGRGECDCREGRRVHINGSLSTFYSLKMKSILLLCVGECAVLLHKLNFSIVKLLGGKCSTYSKSAPFTTQYYYKRSTGTAFAHRSTQKSYSWFASGRLQSRWRRWCNYPDAVCFQNLTAPPLKVVASTIINGNSATDIQKAIYAQKYPKIQVVKKLKSLLMFQGMFTSI